MRISPSSLPRLKGFRYPRKIVAYAVWAYHRFALSTADIEELLAERGVMVSREAVRLWVNRFGAHYAACIRRDRPRPNDKRHMDEAVIPDQWREALALARYRREWRYARYSCAGAAKCQSSLAISGKADCAVWPT